MAPDDRRKRNAMMLVTAGWVTGLAMILMLASMAVYQFDTSQFGQDNPPLGVFYAMLTVTATWTLIAATRSIYRAHWGGSGHQLTGSG